MNWKDTILKNEEIKWKQPKIKLIEDGKVDFILTVELTEILERQARKTFLLAIKDFNDFLSSSPKGESAESFKPKLMTKLKEYGFNITGGN